MSDPTEALGCTADDTAPVPYLQRIRTYYQTLGYGQPYRWAQYPQTPFTPLSKPLSQSRVALVTTAAPYQPDKGDQGPWSAYNAAAKFYQVYTGTTEGEPDVRISHLRIDRKHTSQEDVNTWFPLAQMKRRAQEGRIGAVSPRFYGAPTNRSQQTTIGKDAVAILAAIQTDRADVAVLVAN